MPGQVPETPKIYHIVHYDRLEPIIKEGCLWSDAKATARHLPGTTIGMASIKERRLRRRLSSHPGLHVGDCVPFYFCPRSVMLYVIATKHHKELQYKGGEDSIVHLEADFYAAVNWAQQHGQRWAITDGNAAANASRDFSSLNELDALDWGVIHDPDGWKISLRRKQAEYLVEAQFPWQLIERIGCKSNDLTLKVRSLRDSLATQHQPLVGTASEWYHHPQGR